MSVLYVGMGTCLIMPLIAVLLLVFDIEWDNEMILAMILGNIFMLSCLAVFVFIWVKNNKLKRKIVLWMQDAIETGGLFLKNRRS
ncbi:hypothetical protein FACS1894211_15210 [Clostridia bacterium]|nr:hypothetical protein FACS1894211_15210 [Clostridia bacterium]